VSADRAEEEPYPKPPAPETHVVRAVRALLGEINASADDWVTAMQNIAELERRGTPPSIADESTYDARIDARRRLTAAARALAVLTSRNGE